MVSIIVKALNEERRIARCIESALREASGLDAEIVVVDSLSTDRTVEIAKRYPVRIVQFERLEDRGCGAAVQLGYQFARGDFLYLLDADMQMQPGILKLTLQTLQSDPSLGGVAGRLLDAEVRTQADARRTAAALNQIADIEVHELGGGGLYRREAVEPLGYLAHRGLAAFEEAELGLRLRVAGWRLRRLQAPGVIHEGHEENNWAMLRRLWRNGRAKSTAVFLMSSVGQPWWRLALKKQVHVIAVPAWHALAFAAAWFSPSGLRLLVWASVWLALMAYLALRKHSFVAAAWSLLFWHYFAGATILGLSQQVADPRIPVPGRELAGHSVSE